MYDQREKAQRDYEWAISGAREQGREEGREEGEQIGLEKGTMSGKIQMLEELLGDTPTTEAELHARSLTSLTTCLAALQQRLRDRQA